MTCSDFCIMTVSWRTIMASTMHVFRSISPSLQYPNSQGRVWQKYKPTFFFKGTQRSDWVKKKITLVCFSEELQVHRIREKKMWRPGTTHDRWYFSFLRQKTIEGVLFEEKMRGENHSNYWVHTRQQQKLLFTILRVFFYVWKKRKQLFPLKILKEFLTSVIGKPIS